MRVSRGDLLSLLRKATDMDQYVDRVRGIINDVKEHGDEALLRLTSELDGVKLSSIELSQSELRALASGIEPRVREALDEVMASVESFNTGVKPRDFEDYHRGLRRGVKWVPLSRVGLYVPKGYFSTLVMTGVLAKVAGVEEIIAVTPPRRDGLIDPEIAYVALRLNARVFRVGGAQAVAALAFGTESVPRVDKIIGPGNAYVQAAKLLVSSHVGIDGVEGPTELVTCADPGIKPITVALDLAAQLEHAGAVGVVVTWSEGYLTAIEDELSKLTNAPYFSTLVNEPSECVNVINEVAPEHASIWGVKIPIEGIRNAGAVSIMAPSALVDYAAGPSHVLPTGGSARWRGVLTPMDFMKPIAYVEPTSGDEARRLGELGAVLGLREGFRRHSEALTNWINEE
ncbi:histidinol dehydrogenase [Caldivirga maquilingensis]|uniref:Histidinol dehydrogenase n=1 Tax=Caldivirga maquilingensis (strain ATCC 700844 / DSM 13496 / JCM 10307 / IC-167) TaxID=397948 RepID=A8M914_CALMQ|nr:histidinol dehydrogenase [Caldivirga maquilingensis]ABW02233.1 Histidinol dehydrogenase [Caldivirga maquilingensis IC-167]